MSRPAASRPVKTFSTTSRAARFARRRAAARAAGARELASSPRGRPSSNNEPTAELGRLSASPAIAATINTAPAMLRIRRARHAGPRSVPALNSTRAPRPTSTAHRPAGPLLLDRSGMLRATTGFIAPPSLASVRDARPQIDDEAPTLDLVVGMKLPLRTFDSRGARD